MYSIGIENNLQLARNALIRIRSLKIRSPQSLYTPTYAKSRRYQHLRLSVPQFTEFSRTYNPMEFGQLEDEIGIEMVSTVRDITRRYGGYSKPFFGGFGLYRQHGCCGKLPQEIENARIAEIIRITKEKFIGGCEAQSWVVYDYLVNEKQVSVKVQVVALNNYDHWFVIIGEEPNAVVCDPWAFNVYPLHELQQQIQFLLQVKAIGKTSWLDSSFSYIVVRSNDSKAHYD